MGKFLMICYVAAAFGPYKGEMFSVTPSMIGTFVEAPEWIKDTLMFKWLVNDGSIKVAEQQITKKQGENDPMQGVSAEGKAEEISEAQEAEIVEAATEEPKEEPVKPKRTRKKKADDAE